MPQVDVNWIAVVLGAVISMVLGFVWYSTSVFGKMWMKEIGKTEKELKDGANGGMYAIAFISALLLAYIMTHFVSYVGAKDAMDGATTGFWAWIGFTATAGLSKKIFHSSSWMLFAIDYGYNLVQYVIVGAIVAHMQ